MAGSDGWPLCDLHSHILPGMDDGCKTPEESCRVLQMCAEQGVQVMAATPHYYAEETVDAFLARRAAAMARLENAMQGREGPQICLGAEVAYYPALLQEEAIESLCIGRSNYLLLEMPFSRWTPGVVRTVRALRYEQGVVPILAHVERYLEMGVFDALRALMDSGVLVQMNASYLVHERRGAMRLLRRGMVDVLGSDCHGLEHRPPQLGPAWELMNSKRLRNAAEHIAETSAEIMQWAAERPEKDGHGATGIRSAAGGDRQN